MRRSSRPESGPRPRCFSKSTHQALRPKTPWTRATWARLPSGFALARCRRIGHPLPSPAPPLLRSPTPPPLLPPPPLWPLRHRHPSRPFRLQVSRTAFPATLHVIGDDPIASSSLSRPPGEARVVSGLFWMRHESEKRSSMNVAARRPSTCTPPKYGSCEGRAYSCSEKPPTSTTRFSTPDTTPTRQEPIATKGVS